MACLAVFLDVHGVPARPLAVTGNTAGQVAGPLRLTLPPAARLAEGSGRATLLAASRLREVPAPRPAGRPGA